LQDITSSPNKEIKEVVVEQVIKWDRGNDLWAAVLVEPAEKLSTLFEQYLINGVPEQIQDLIRQYGGIFQVPTSLPPSRNYDHSIALIPNAAPINCRPYRYSPK
jgi:hypothetical protein